MSNKCELSGVRVLYGNKVSHSQRKTRRCFKLNLRSVTYSSEITGQEYKFYVNAKCIRSVEKAGGFDAYLIKVSNDALSEKAQKAKKAIVKKKIEAM